MAAKGLVGVLARRCTHDVPSQPPTTAAVLTMTPLPKAWGHSSVLLHPNTCGMRDKGGGGISAVFSPQHVWFPNEIRSSTTICLHIEENCWPLTIGGGGGSRKFWKAHK